RHASMQSLLDALAKDPARTRRRWLAVAGIAAATGAVSAAASVAVHARVRMCTSGEDKLAGIWEGSATPSSPRQAAIRRAFIATGVPYAETTFKGVQQILDRFVDG